MLPCRVLAALILTVSAARADEYYVSPSGDDQNSGRFPREAWKTLARVNGSLFKPGDRILFARGGEWRESLKASSSGGAGNPITYEAYGAGAKPRFFGSDVLRHREFRDGGGGRYTLPVAKRVASVLVDGRFLSPGSWSWSDGTLSVASPDRDPRKGGLWTACVRVDPVHSNGKNHLVFRNLVADESADARDGYGFRIMGSDGVLVEDCEAYRAGRHHFGVINSTRFTGRRLLAALAMPDCPGGCTFYVSFSDSSRKGDTHRWIDCVGKRFENPGQRNYQVFYDHGEGLGPIVIENMISKGGQFTVASSRTAPLTIRGGRIEDNSLVVFGSHATVEGVTIVGDGAIDLFANDTVLVNIFADLDPRKGGPTGYGAGVVVREKAARNEIRFSTLRLKTGPGVVMAGKGASLRLVATAVISGEPVRGSGFEDGGSNHLGTTAGDAKLDARGVPHKGSPLIGAADVPESNRPPKDAAGRARPKGRRPSIGAFEPR